MPAEEDTIEFLAILVRQVALLWDNLRLRTTVRLAEELSREISAARRIQCHLFPRDAQLDPRLDLAAENVPALTISGDYYDYQLMEPGRVAFILADVMGHGLPAALLMASVQPVFRAAVQTGEGLRAIDRRIHEVVAAAGNGETFVTGLVGVCDLAKPELRLLAAGHLWPSICCEGQRVDRQESAYCPPWGLSMERNPEPATVPLPQRDWSVVAFTDGIADCTTADGSSYGVDRLVEVHERCKHEPAEDLCDRILADVTRAHSSAAPQEDDMTLLILRDGLPAQAAEART